MTQTELMATATNSLTPLEIIQQAIAGGIDTDKLGQLMDLQERWEANEARKAYTRAMAAFQKNPPSIEKASHVKFGNTEYDHALLEDVAGVIREALSERGFSFRWKTDSGDGSSGVTVTCIITHEMGHSEETTLTAPADTSGSKNSIQSIGSTVTYLQRYTLLAATGLAPKGVDNDARAVDTINENQEAEIRALMQEVNANEVRFLAFLGVDKLGDLPASRMRSAISALEAKR